MDGEKTPVDCLDRVFGGCHIGRFSPMPSAILIMRDGNGMVIISENAGFMGFEATRIIIIKYIITT